MSARVQVQASGHRLLSSTEMQGMPTPPLSMEQVEGVKRSMKSVAESGMSPKPLSLPSHQPIMEKTLWTSVRPTM
ncbi:hypothetical protein P7K49_027905 [Saguinus oedipus]|uniref:Uncharacterized protein n=1 Tax=Saguinus oedipus TaxID=9490 RepID=A0ABQ9UAT5_SAGOE|nr:hypothetical protein P7K49_027905 [Saguinus oedipus]